MPIGLVPEAIALICLKADEARPESQRVYFKARFLTCRESERVYELGRQAADQKIPPEETEKIMRDAFAIGIVGPVNAETRDGRAVPCTIDGIKEVLSITEMWDLLWSYPTLLGIAE